jgi:N6-adenosine-specific RNA methylase IME4
MNMRVRKKKRFRPPLSTRKRKRKKRPRINYDDVKPPKKRRKTKSVTLERYGFKYNYKRRRPDNFCDIYTTKEQFDLILIDPPWWYQNPTKNKARQMKADQKYPTMTFEELVKFGEHIKRIADKDCVLLMWVTATKMSEGCKLIEEWGFEYVTVFKNWQKTNARGTGRPTQRGGGTYSLIASEYLFLGMQGKPINFKYLPAQFILGNHVLLDNISYLVIGKKGSIIKFRSDNPKDYFVNNNVDKRFIINDEIKDPKAKRNLTIDEIIAYHKQQHDFLKYVKENHKNLGPGEKLKLERCWELLDRGRHSEKPKEFYGDIEKVFKPKKKKNKKRKKNIRRIEIFARNTRPGWKCFGNDEAIV